VSGSPGKPLPSALLENAILQVLWSVPTLKAHLAHRPVKTRTCEVRSPEGIARRGEAAGECIVVDLISTEAAPGYRRACALSCGILGPMG